MSTDNETTIHIRRNADDGPAKPAECGKVNGRTITEAWGFYGPTGDGWSEVCKACVAARRARKAR